MKTSLIIFGVIFLVIGGLFLFIPRQTAQATTTTNGETTDVRTSSATVLIPAMWSYAAMFIGLVLLILGFVLGGSERVTKRSTTVEHVPAHEDVHETTVRTVHKE